MIPVNTNTHNIEIACERMWQATLSQCVVTWHATVTTYIGELHNTPTRHNTRRFYQPNYDLLYFIPNNKILNSNFAIHYYNINVKQYYTVYLIIYQMTAELFQRALEIIHTYFIIKRKEIYMKNLISLCCSLFVSLNLLCTKE